MGVHLVHPRWVGTAFARSVYPEPVACNKNVWSKPNGTFTIYAPEFWWRHLSAIEDWEMYVSWARCPSMALSSSISTTMATAPCAEQKYAHRFDLTTPAQGNGWRARLISA